MPRLHVCSLDRMPREVARLGASHVVTLLREPPVPTPEGIAAGNHLRVSINDISAPQDGLVHPAAAHIEELLHFVRRWDQKAPMLIHCWAGISRSTAACFITHCALNAPGREDDVAREMRRLSPTATPNALMVQLADELLERNGRMLQAIQGIGRGEDAHEGIPFSISAVSR
jgi:predicted protein tyrosine phosphatase